MSTPIDDPYPWDEPVLPEPPIPVCDRCGYGPCRCPDEVEPAR